MAKVCSTKMVIRSYLLQLVEISDRRTDLPGITIPLMRKAGFPPRFAAGVEAAASTGGQLMPPVMGSTAFVMASFLGISYGEIALAATIPALLFYFGLMVQIDAYAARQFDERALSSLDFQSSINLLKVEASELAVDTVMSAMRACGLSGYRNDGDFTLGRHLRDVLSAPLMINNDRILANIGTANLMSPVPASLRD